MRPLLLEADCGVIPDSMPVLRILGATLKHLCAFTALLVLLIVAAFIPGE